MRPTPVTCIPLTAALLPLLMGAACIPTIDPPPPPTLDPPVFTTSDLQGRPDRDGAYREFVHLEWHLPSTDSISIVRLDLVRTLMSGVSTVLPLTSSATDFDEPTGPLEVIRTDACGFIIYRLVAIDTLWRAGDTSRVCSLFLAPLFEMMNPTDTLHSPEFTYRLNEQLYDECEEHMYIWNNEGAYWQSDTLSFFTQSAGSGQRSRNLTAPFYPLPTGTYHWGVKLTVGKASSVAVEAFGVY